MKLIINLLISVVTVLIACQLVPGVQVDSLTTAFLVAIVFGILNAFIKPILVLLTLPITVVTLGLFYVLINIGLVYLTSWIVPGFAVTSFWGALFFSIVVALVSWFFNLLKK